MIRPSWHDFAIDLHQKTLRIVKLDRNRKAARRFTASALAGETGELLNLLKKEQVGFPYDEDKREQEIEDEMADVMIYLYCLIDDQGMDIDEAVNRKLIAYHAKLKKAGLLDP